jgi:branched-chain amino acid transport system substrate-binding protein
MTHRGWTVAIATALTALLSAAVAGSAAGATSAEPITIGFVGAKTGFMSIYDSQVFAGAQVAANQINAKGGLLGGRKIRFVTCDSKTDQAQSAACAAEVLGKGANFVMPSCDFDFGAPAARAAGNKGVVAIGCAGGLEYGVQGVGPLLFNTYPGSADEGSIMAEWGYQKKGWRKAYVMTDVFLEYTKDVSEFFTKRWQELGGQIVGRDTFNNSDASIAAQISRFRADGQDADVIVLSSLPPGGASALRQIRAAGINLPVLAAAAFDGSYWLNTVPNLSNFYYPALGSLFGDDPSPVRKRFLGTQVAKVLGKKPTHASYPLLGYAAVETLGKGVTAAKSTNGKAVAAALDKFKKVRLITGPTTYTAKCHIPSGRPYLIIQIQDGKNTYTGTSWTPKKVPAHPC